MVIVCSHRMKMLVGTSVSREDEDLLGVGGFQAAVLRRLEATCATSQCPSPVTGASQSGRAEPVPAVAECLTHARASLRLSHGTARPQQHPKTLRRAQTRTGTLALLKRKRSLRNVRGRSRVPFQDPRLHGGQADPGSASVAFFNWSLSEWLRLPSPAKLRGPDV